MNKKTLYNFVFPIITMMIWGSLYTCISLTYKYIGVDKNSVPDIFVFAGLRFTICGTLMTLISVITGDWKASFSGCSNKEIKKSILVLLAVALLYIVVQYVFTYLGTGMVGSANTALIKQIASVVFIPISFLFFKEDKFSIGKVIGAILGILAIVALNIGKGSLISAGLGQLFLIIASLGILAGNIISKFNSKQIKPFVMTGVSQLVGGLIMLIAGLLLSGKLPTFREAGSDVVSVKGIIVSVYIIIATLISYGLWYTCLAKANLSGMFILKLSESIFAAIFGALLVGETASVLRSGFFLALGLLVLAVLVANMWDKIFKKKKTSGLE